MSAEVIVGDSLEVMAAMEPGSIAFDADREGEAERHVIAALDGGRDGGWILGRVLPEFRPKRYGGTQ